MKIIRSVLFGTLIAGACTAFTTLTSRRVHHHAASSTSALAAAASDVSPSDRRSFLKQWTGAIAATLIGSVLTSSSARADVSDGNRLPPGALEFSKVLKVKSDLVIVRKRVLEAGDSMDKKEWNGVGDFLSRVAKSQADLQVIAESIYDPEKKKGAAKAMEDISKYAGAAITFASKDHDVKSVVNVLNRCEKSYDDFFDLLRDVPDEI
mmetsp:Transcript_41419/g.61299  ORF Transcript_41419/g.61299 Transcript_41419/m.61299 type:complete len:208 (-) Transcript_41419:106-729(-)